MEHDSERSSLVFDHKNISHSSQIYQNVSTVILFILTYYYWKSINPFKSFLNGHYSLNEVNFSMGHPVVGLNLCWVDVNFVRWGCIQNFKPLGPVTLVEVEFPGGWCGGGMNSNNRVKPSSVKLRLCWGWVGVVTLRLG